MSLQELMDVTVTVSGKRPQSLSTVPAIVTHVSAQNIEDYGGMGLVDVFNRQPSMMVMGSAGLQHMYMATRGGKLTHTDNWNLMLLNGRPLRETHSGGLNSDIYAVFPMEALQQVEIMRGPGSVLYGSNAFTSVTNLVTKSPSEDFSASGKLSLGSFGSVKLSAQAGDQVGDFSYFTAIGLLDVYQSEVNTPESFESDTTFTLEERYLRGDSWLFTADYKGFSFNTLIGNHEQFGQVFLTAFGDPAISINRRFVDLGYDWQLNEDHSIDFHFTYNGHDLVDPGDIARSKGMIFEITSLNSLNEQWDLLAGVLYENFRGDFSILPNDAYQEDRFSVYVQADYNFTHQHHFIMGIQFNTQEGQDGDFSTRLGWVYSIDDHWGTKLLYGEAFRSASAFQKVESGVNSTRDFRGNPDLKPEQIASIDAQISYWDEQRYGALTAFYSKIDEINERVSEGEGSIRFINSEVDVMGIEMEGSYVLSQHWQTNVSFMYQKNEDGNNESRLFNPQRMLKFGLLWSSSQYLSIAIANNLYARPPDVDEELIEDNVLDGYSNMMTVNINFSLASWQAIAFSLYLDNVLDEKLYYKELGFTQEGPIPEHNRRGAYFSISASL